MVYLNMPVSMDFQGELCGIVPRLVGFPYENALRSSSLEATNCDIDFADDEEKAFSTSAVIRLVVGELSGTL